MYATRKEILVFLYGLSLDLGKKLFGVIHVMRKKKLLFIDLEN